MLPALGLQEHATTLSFSQGCWASKFSACLENTGHTKSSLQLPYLIFWEKFSQWTSTHVEVRGQSLLHHGSEDQTLTFRLVWQVPLSAEPFFGFHLRLSSSTLYSLRRHMAYCILISCWVDLPVTHICIICRLVIMLFIPFLYRTFHPDIFLLVRLI